MSKITITVSGPVGVGKSTLCAKLEILLKHLGCQVEWIGGGVEKNLMLEDWSDMQQTPIEIVERVDISGGTVSHLQPVNFGREDGRCTEVDGCPTERAVLQRFWRAHAGRKPQLIDQEKVDELINTHSEWTPQGFAIVDSHRLKFAKDLLTLGMARLHEPTFREFGGGKDTFTYAEFGKAHDRMRSGQSVQMSERMDEQKIDASAESTCNTGLDMPVKQVFPVVGDPVGFMMKHLSGHDTGFSWNKDDPQFSQEWERISLFSQEQMADAMRQMAQEYNERAKKWRDAFEAMHHRAMKAEAKLELERRKS